MKMKQNKIIVCVEQIPTNMILPMVLMATITQDTTC